MARRPRKRLREDGEAVRGSWGLRSRAVRLLSVSFLVDCGGPPENSCLAALNHLGVLATVREKSSLFRGAIS